MSEEALPRLDPAEAIAWFKAKGFEIGFDWRDVWQEEHARAFTVAKAMSRDLLEDIREAVDRALSDGQTLQQFSKELRPKLQARGWWGKALQEDPATGETRVVQLGSPARLRTIYETNLRTSYMAGKWQQIERGKKTHPFLRYISMMDGRERPEHHAWHGTVLPVDHPWWDTHYGPCGWGCRCRAQSLNQRMLDRRGWKVEAPQQFPVRDYINKRTGEVTRLERGIDPGWSYNVGKAPLDGLTPAPRLAGAGENGELQAVMSEAAYEPVRGFFSAFGLTSREAAVAGRVWTDPAGWPVPISAGLLRGADGAMVRFDAGQARELAIAARVLLEPESIGWIWVTGKDGRAMLVRRYRSKLGVVDLAGAFWRWRSDAGGAPGLVVWTAEAGELQAYNPRQPRDANGRFASAGGHGGGTAVVDFARSAAGDRSFVGEIDLGVSDGRAMPETKGYRQILQSQRAHDIWRKHGPDGKRADDNPLTLDDFAAIPKILALNQGKAIGRPGGGKGQRIRHDVAIDGQRYVMFETVGHAHRRTSIATLYKPDGKKT